MLLCFNFLTETTTWIGRVSYRGATRSPVGNTLVFVGFLCWKLDIKNLGKCVQNVLLYRYAAKSKQTQIMCSVGKDWVKPGKSSSQCSNGAGGSEGSTLSSAQPSPWHRAWAAVATRAAVRAGTCVARDSKPWGEWAAQPGRGQYCTTLKTVILCAKLLFFWTWHKLVVHNLTSGIFSPQTVFLSRLFWVLFELREINTQVPDILFRHMFL